jgi:hypothetical protein
MRGVWVCALLALGHYLSYTTVFTTTHASSLLGSCTKSDDYLVSSGPRVYISKSQLISKRAANSGLEIRDPYTGMSNFVRKTIQHERSEIQQGAKEPRLQP